MMGALREWLLGIIAAALIVSVLYALVPKGALRSAAHLAGGLVLLLTVLRPVMGLRMEELQVRWEDWEAAIEEQIGDYQADTQRQMEELIEAETGAYISKKAAELGRPCRVQVETEVRDGMPFPCGAALDIGYDAALSRWMAEELAIPAERQQWEVTNVEP